MGKACPVDSRCVLRWKGRTMRLHSLLPFSFPRCDLQLARFCRSRSQDSVVCARDLASYRFSKNSPPPECTTPTSPRTFALSTTPRLGPAGPGGWGLGAGPGTSGFKRLGTPATCPGGPGWPRPRPRPRAGVPRLGKVLLPTVHRRFHYYEHRGLPGHQVQALPGAFDQGLFSRKTEERSLSPL